MDLFSTWDVPLSPHTSVFSAGRPLSLPAVSISFSFSLFSFLFPHLQRRLSLLFVAAGLLCASFFAPAFHSRSAVCGRKRDDVPGRPRSHRVWGSLHACRGRDPAAYVPSPFLQHGGTGVGKADPQHGNGRLRIQAAQTGQHHNGNTHCQGQRLKNDRDDLVKWEAILFYNPEAARLSRLSSQIFQRFGII